MPGPTNLYKQWLHENQVLSSAIMADDSGDHSDGNSSFAHKHSTEPLRLRQLHAAPNHADQTTPPSSTRQSTDIIENDSDVLEVRKGAEKTAAILNEKDQDPNLIGWDGIFSSSPGIAMQVNPTELSSQVPTILKIPRIGPKARNTSSRSSTPS